MVAIAPSEYTSLSVAMAANAGLADSIHNATVTSIGVVKSDSPPEQLTQATMSITAEQAQAKLQQQAAQDALIQLKNPDAIAVQEGFEEGLARFVKGQPLTEAELAGVSASVAEKMGDKLAANAEQGMATEVLAAQSSPSVVPQNAIERLA